MKPGVYPGISRAEYEAIDAVNQSRLKGLRPSPAHGRWMELHPKEPTAALNLGQAIHHAMLEPEKFAREYACAPVNPTTGKDYDRRTTKGKEAWAEFEARNQGKVLLKVEEYQKATAVRDALWAKPRIAEILGGRGTNEICVVWEDQLTGLLCKALLDRLTRDEGMTLAVDLKSTRTAAPERWGREVVEFGYHIQAAFYLDGLFTLKPMERRFAFVAVEKDPPFESKPYLCAESVIDQGRIEYQALLARYAACKQTDTWPGYPPALEEFVLPEWAYRDAKE